MRQVVCDKCKADCTDNHSQRMPASTQYELCLKCDKGYAKLQTELYSEVHKKLTNFIFGVEK